MYQFATNLGVQKTSTNLTTIANSLLKEAADTGTTKFIFPEGKDEEINSLLTILSGQGRHFIKNA